MSLKKLKGEQINNPIRNDEVNREIHDVPHKHGNGPRGVGVEKSLLGREV